MTVTIRPLGHAGLRASVKPLVAFQEEPTSDMYFPSAAHEEVLARLLYLIEEQDRCGILTGEAGVGKSTIMIRLHQMLRRSGWKTRRIDLAGIDHTALLLRLASELGINPPSNSDSHDLWDQIELVIASAARVHQPWVFLFDHADRLRPGALSLLEQLLHTPHSKGLVMMFACRPEGKTPLMKLLTEHTGLRIELPALTCEETHWYVDHALDRGTISTPEFTQDAVHLLHRITGGVPLHVNRLCRASILTANAEHRPEIHSELVLSVAEELLDLQPMG